MVDLKVLERCGCTSERLRAIFTASNAKIEKRPKDEESDDEKKAYDKSCSDYKLRKKWEDRIWERILEGIGINCRNARPFQAVDMAMDAAPIMKDSVPLLLWAQGKIKMEAVRDCLQRDAGEAGVSRFFQKTEKNELKLNIPRITETPINIVRSYVTRRLAAMDALWSNQWPLFKYDPRGKDPVSQLRADALTQRIDIMADAYGYRRQGSQWRRDMLMYSRSVVFPRQKWDCQIGWRFEKTNTGVPSDKIESFVEREGLDFVNPHPSRTYYDLNTPLAGINTDTGPSWIGYWDIVRYGSLVENKGLPYYNLDQLWISEGWENLFNSYKDYFFYYFDPCVLKWPNMSLDPSAANGRTGNIGVYSSAPISGPLDSSTQALDCGVITCQHFERINPKCEGFGDYDAEVWVRFVIGGAGTVMFAEYLPSLPAIYGGINVNDNRLENQSMAMELLSYQDQLTNIVTTMLEQLRSSFVQMWILDKDILSEEQIKMFEKNAGNREWWMEPRLLIASLSKIKEMGYGAPQQAFQIIQQQATNAVTQALTAMNQLLNMADRLLILSPNELGQPNPREVSARESQEISTSVQSIYSFINQGPREQIAALKELLYETLLTCGTDRFELPTIRRYTRKTIEDAGFTIAGDVGDVESLPAGTKVIGSLKDLRYDYFFDSRDGADRVASSQSTQAMVQLLQILAQDPEMRQDLGKEKIYELLNGIIRSSGTAIDFQFEVGDGESQDFTAAPPAPPQPPGLPPEVVQMLQQQDGRLRQLEGLLQRMMGAGAPSGPQVPQPPPQAASPAGPSVPGPGPGAPPDLAQRMAVA